MAYSKSIRAVERNRPILEELYRRRKTMTWTSPEPSKLAYRIRESIHAASHHDSTRHLASLRSMYEFKIMPNEVQARFIGTNTTGIHVTTQQEPQPSQKGPVKIEVDIAISSVHGIVGAIIDHENADEVYFPHVTLTQADLVKLYNWTSENGWNIIEHEGAGLTLTRLDVGEELTWRPKGSPE